MTPRVHSLCISFLAFTSLTLTACAVDRFGALAARVDAADGAIIYTTYGAGLLLRTQNNDPGLSIGYSKRMCLAAAAANNPAAGWYFLKLPSLPERCYAADRATIGTEIRTGPHDYSVTIGARFTTLIAETHGDEHYAVFFDTSAPKNSYLYIHTTRSPE